MTENPFPNANFLKAAEALHLSILGRGMTTSIAMIAAALEKANNDGVDKERCRCAGITTNIADVFRSRHLSDYAQGYVDACDVANLLIEKGGGGNGDS